jgi:hypothetical protein
MYLIETAIQAYPRTWPTTARMSVRRSRASLCSVTRICCRMISAEVIGRRARPGETGPDVWLSVRPIIGCVPDDIRLALSPNAFLILLPTMTLDPEPATGDDTSPSAMPPRAPAPPDERQDMKKISYAVSRSSTGPSASTRPNGQSRSAAAKSRPPVSDRDAEEPLEAERDRWWGPISSRQG